MSSPTDLRRSKRLCQSNDTVSSPASTPEQPPPPKRRRLRPSPQRQPTSQEVENARLAAAGAAMSSAGSSSTPSYTVSAASGPLTTSSTTPSTTAAPPANSAPAAPVAAPLAHHPGLSLPPSSKPASRAFARLLALPAFRVPAQHPGSSAINLDTPGNRDAYLAQAVGSVASPACSHCTKSNGAWVGCVVVPGYFLGSCANCHYNNEGPRCTLRPCKYYFFYSRLLSTFLGVSRFFSGQLLIFL
jgi:hypothetical protein